MARQTPYLAAGIALCGLLCSPPPAAAQLAASGGSFLVAPGGVRGTASAYDSQNNTFLAVGAYGAVTGRLVKPDGTFASNPFQIDLGSGFAHYPSVAYSPHADSGRGAFLVTWHSNVGTFGNLVHARLVGATGALLGAQLILGSEPTWWESAPSVDYATTSQVFMVTWRIGAYQIRAARISITGQNLDAGAGILVTTSGGERDPSIAYNPENDHFLIAYADFLGGGSHVYGRLLSAFNGAFGPAQLLGAGTATYITDATFSTGAHKFLVGWYQLPGGATGRLVNGDGTPSGNPIPLSSRFGTYDSLGVAYNRVTQSSLVVGQDLLSAENGGVEISETGGPGSTAVLTNAGGSVGNFYPQVSASTLEGKWMLTTAHNFASVVAQFTTAPPSRQAPIVTQQPGHRTVFNGEPVSFTAAATGGPAPTVQWEMSADGRSWAAVPGATSTTFSFTARRTDTRKQFRAHFMNTVAPDAWSNAATLIVTAAPIDIDGDGKSDPLVWRARTGEWFWSSSSTNKASDAPVQWGNQALGDVVLNGDVDGDGAIDLVLWRPGEGTWYWLTSSSGYAREAQSQKQWGNQALGDIPMLADVDGDGMADLIVWRASTGTWYWLTSSSGYDYAKARFRQWGNSALGDVPLVSDFDGDRKADFAVWRASTGTWYWLTSSSGYHYGSARFRQWGNSALGDQPFLGDFDGDHLADLAVWRASTGTWFWLNSSTFYSYAPANIGVKQWGNLLLDDRPALTDFDGDLKADLTVWRASTGTWYWLTSSSGYTGGDSKQWGTAGDIPIVR